LDHFILLNDPKLHAMKQSENPSHAQFCTVFYIQEVNQHPIFICPVFFCKAIASVLGEWFSLTLALSPNEHQGFEDFT
jgi:hypothetical protein